MTDKEETLSQIEQHLSALDELFRDVTLDTKYVHALEAENAELRMENEKLKRQLNGRDGNVDNSAMEGIAEYEQEAYEGSMELEDIARGECHAFLLAWHDIFGGKWVDASQVIQKLEEDISFAEKLPSSLRVAFDSSVKSSSVSLSKRLGRFLVNRASEGFNLIKGRDPHRKVYLWKVMPSKWGL